MKMTLALQPASSCLTLILVDVSLDDHLVGTMVLVRQVVREVDIDCRTSEEAEIPAYQAKPRRLLGLIHSFLGKTDLYCSSED